MFGFDECWRYGDQFVELLRLITSGQTKFAVQAARNGNAIKAAG
jgi:hypothetical protein